MRAGGQGRSRLKASLGQTNTDGTNSRPRPPSSASSWPGHWLSSIRPCCQIGRPSTAASIQAQGEPGTDEYRRNEQQAAPAKLGVLVAWPLAELDPALLPAQAGVQPGQRGRPAPGGELPGAVHHVPFEDGPQRGPIGRASGRERG